MLQQHRAAALDGDRSGLDINSQAQVQGSPALSLKARETASLSLKRIFDQQVMMISAAGAVRSASDDAENHVNSDHQQHQRCASASDGIDLELRLAAPYYTSSYGSASDTEDETVNQRKLHDQTKSSVDAAVGKAQLTIFYAGKLCVYEDIPADKAKAIILLAAGSRDHPSRANHGNAPARRSRHAIPASSSDMLISGPAKLVARSRAELPLARTASLTRFFEKRKERLEAKEGPMESDVNNDETLTSTSDSQPPQKKSRTIDSVFPTKF